MHVVTGASLRARACLPVAAGEAALDIEGVGVLGACGGACPCLEGGVGGDHGRDEAVEGHAWEGEGHGCEVNPLRTVHLGRGAAHCRLLKRERDVRRQLHHLANVHHTQVAHVQRVQRILPTQHPDDMRLSLDATPDVCKNSRHPLKHGTVRFLAELTQGGLDRFLPFVTHTAEDGELLPLVQTEQHLDGSMIYRTSPGEDTCGLEATLIDGEQAFGSDVRPGQVLCGLGVVLRRSSAAPVVPPLVVLVLLLLLWGLVVVVVVVLLPPVPTHRHPASKVLPWKLPPAKPEAVTLHMRRSHPRCWRHQPMHAVLPIPTLVHVMLRHAMLHLRMPRVPERPPAVHFLRERGGGEKRRVRGKKGGGCVVCCV